MAYEIRKEWVYVLTFLPTGKSYVGKSCNPFWRMKAHISALKAGRHNSEDFQRDYDKFKRTGEADDFHLSVVCEKKGAVKKSEERYVIKSLCTYDEKYGYNCQDPFAQPLRRKEGLQVRNKPSPLKGLKRDADYQFFNPDGTRYVCKPDRLRSSRC